MMLHHRKGVLSFQNRIPNVSNPEHRCQQAPRDNHGLPGNEEPGVFLLRPDQSIYYISVQSMPFVRPNFQEMVQALDFIISTDYPARGEYIGAV
jgi:hypothetical protein